MRAADVQLMRCSRAHHDVLAHRQMLSSGFVRAVYATANVSGGCALLLAAYCELTVVMIATAMRQSAQQASHGSAQLTSNFSLPVIGT